jgi:hypothetical protein
MSREPVVCHLKRDTQLICEEAGLNENLRLPIYGGARRLIRLGFDLNRPAYFYRGSTPVVEGWTLGHLAQFKVSEPDRGPIRRRKVYDPHKVARGEQ